LDKARLLVKIAFGLCIPVFYVKMKHATYKSSGLSVLKNTLVSFLRCCPIADYQPKNFVLRMAEINQFLK